MVPRKLAPLLFGFILSGLMSLLVSGITIYRTAGEAPGLLGLWASAWLSAWMVAFPVVLVAAPLTRRVVDALLAPE